MMRALWSPRCLDSFLLHKRVLVSFCGQAINCNVVAPGDRPLAVLVIVDSDVLVEDISDLRPQAFRRVPASAGAPRPHLSPRNVPSHVLPTKNRATAPDAPTSANARKPPP